jgi:sulfur carrier protein ThiS
MLKRLYVGVFRMRIHINNREEHVKQGLKLIQLLEAVRQQSREDPRVKTIAEKTGKDHLIFALNGRVIRPHEFEEIEIHEEDRVRWVIPHMGG